MKSPSSLLPPTWKYTPGARAILKRKLRHSLLGSSTSLAALILTLAGQPLANAQLVTDNFDSGSLSSDWQQRNTVQFLGGFVNNSFVANGSGLALRLQRGSGSTVPLGVPQDYGTGRGF